MSINNKLLCLALIMVTGVSQANTVSRQLIINNKSDYDLKTLGKISNDIDFILPMTIPSTAAKVVPLTIDNGAWYDLKYPQASFNFAVQCRTGGQDTIMVVIKNNDPVVVQASSFQPRCVKVLQDRQNLTFSSSNSSVQIDIVNK